MMAGPVNFAYPAKATYPADYRSAVLEKAGALHLPRPTIT